MKFARNGGGESIGGQCVPRECDVRAAQTLD